jgi:hypothetical protein
MNRRLFDKEFQFHKMNLLMVGIMTMIWIGGYGLTFPGPMNGIQIDRPLVQYLSNTGIVLLILVFACRNYQLFGFSLKRQLVHLVMFGVLINCLVRLTQYGAYYHPGLKVIPHAEIPGLVRLYDTGKYEADYPMYHLPGDHSLLVPFWKKRQIVYDHGGPAWQKRKETYADAIDQFARLDLENLRYRQSPNPTGDITWGTGGGAFQPCVYSASL